MPIQNTTSFLKVYYCSFTMKTPELKAFFCSHDVLRTCDSWSYPGLSSSPTTGTIVTREIGASESL